MMYEFTRVDWAIVAIVTVIFFIYAYFWGQDK
jgi:hypothetical protein